ncbi:MAG: PAS domain S-box protein [Chloroflexi bacterium]|nr:PAS domain S-box protein [Chloroflexota bacterium]
MQRSDDRAGRSRQRRAQDELQASQYARSLIEASLDPLVTISPDGKITDVNEATIRVTGVAREQLVGSDFSNYFTEPKKAREGYQQVFAKGSVTDYALTIRHGDGKLTDVLYNASVYKDGRGTVLGVFAAARDITAQKKAGEERSRLAAIVDSSADAIIGKTLNGVVTSWNKGAELMFGYAASEVIGKHISIVIPPQLRDEERSILERLSQGHSIQPYETTRVRRDGGLIDVSVTVSPVRDADGNIVGASKIARDITAQKQASQYARSLIEASLDPLVTISPDGKITDVNEATIRVTGVARDQLVGSDFSNYFTEPDKAREGYRQVFAQGSVTDYPLTIRHKDGELTDVLYNASVYKDVGGNVLGVFAAARDITDQKKAETELQKAHSELELRVQERTAELATANESLQGEIAERRRAEQVIRELSTPVLQVRDGMLILPIIGILDSQRARQLTEQLLRAIRDNRARVAVVDITGVPAVDSKIANHLLQTAEAARLMGATVVLTGLSPEVAQALVSIGVDLSRLTTVGDLQGGIADADRRLGYKVTREGETALGRRA